MGKMEKMEVKINLNLSKPGEDGKDGKDGKNGS